MYRIITLVFLVTYLPWLYASSQDNKISEQVQQDIELLKSIKEFTKQASGSFITVGGDILGCHFSNIQDAIDSIPFSGSGEIRIATNKTYNENIIIDEINVSLIGGYDDCFDAGLPFGPDTTQVQVDGSNVALPALRIAGDILRNTISLKNMALKNGTATSSLLGAGLTAFNADAQVALENVTISNNSGSGLAILGLNNGVTNTDIIMTETTISSNTASLVGGGIYCSGSDASIIMASDSGLIFNQVTASNGQGGGAFISGGCTLSMYSAGMVGNLAKDGGGGLYANNGARINLIGRQVCDGSDCLGDNIRPVRFNGNRGDSDLSDQGNGGAILIKGATTLVDMSQVWIDNNSAFHGGAISVHEGATLMIDRFSKTCWNSHIDDKCNLFESNSASPSNGQGGAIYNDNSIVVLNKAYIENNRADFGTAIYAVGESAASIIDGSVFNHNGNDGITYQDKYVVRANGGAEFLVLNSTFADNHATESVFGISSLLNSHLTVKRSIIHDSSSGAVLNANTGTTEFECILAHDINSIDGTQLFFGDPEFIDRDNGNYHLNASLSPAVDLCIDTFGSRDIDMEFRGWDDPTVINQDNNPDATYDAGADETYDNDIIFKSGF
jgi:Chlamydia polymorphic membrane protein (Chlamydia_PMP).